MAGRQLYKVLSTYREVVEHGSIASVASIASDRSAGSVGYAASDRGALGGSSYRTYAVSSLRTGDGKSTLAFNLTYELARMRPVLTVDLCPQWRTTAALLQGDAPAVTVLDALEPILLGPDAGAGPDDLAYRVSRHCDAFKPVRTTHLVPGSPRLLSLPSLLYQRLQMASTDDDAAAVGCLLDSVRSVVEQAVASTGAEVVLLDTSSFYAGGTHLAWCAADALILPVHVDEASLGALELAFQLLTDPTQDFHHWNQRAGGRTPPRVAAVVVTGARPKSRLHGLLDTPSQAFVERALDIATKYRELFDVEDPADAFVVTDDLGSSGPISLGRSIPITSLKAGAYHAVGGHRLQVDRWVSRYQTELAYLASVLEASR